MIHRLRKVSENLYRGSAPSVEDVIFLNKKLGIKKIVSLDEETGRRIDRATKLLGMKHVMLPIDIRRKGSLIKFLNQDISNLFDNGGPTYVHCQEGKDRTGLAVAIYRCEEQGWSCEKALKEAKRLGFGIGVDPRVVKLYIKLINKACGCNDKHDVSFAYDDENSDGVSNFGYDIVSNQRAYPSDYRDYTLDGWEQQSWSPFEDYRVREFPAAGVDIEWPDQYDTRQTRALDDSEIVDKYRGAAIPQSGTWDTSTNGIMGAGPSLVGSGYI